MGNKSSPRDVELYQRDWKTTVDEKYSQQT